jgi:XTP/dITP diphosphohydrolase
MNRRRVVLATRNLGKVRELASLLDEPRIELVSLGDVAPPDFDVEETGASFEDNARLKAEAIAKLSGLPALADDSGLEVDALDGRPGVRSKRYAGERASDAENNAHLLHELSGVPAAERSARFVCVLVLAEPVSDGARTRIEVRGTCEGIVSDAPRGSSGFGYDPLFIPNALSGRTLGEVSAEEKNALSHRAAAARALAHDLAAWLAEGA